MAVLLGLMLLTTAAFQTRDAGAAVYDRVADAVVLLVVEDDKGNPLGQGSGFLIEGGFLVTNAHVVRGGRVFVKTGAFKIPCVIVKTDSSVDLALLKPSAEISARPLTLASGAPSNGTTIFALGNPQGLERTISQGLVTGTRTVDRMSLLQISAPISPGSSGGPVVSGTGEVIGVAVSSLEDGQNLNFAVPVGTLASFVKGERSSNTDSLLAALIPIRGQQRALMQKGDFGPRWTELLSEEETLLDEALSAAGASLPEVMKVVTSARGENSNAWLRASRRAHELAKPPTAEILEHLASAIRANAFGYEGDDEQRLLREAELIATKLVSLRPTGENWLLLAQIQSGIASKNSAAYQNAAKSLVVSPPASDPAEVHRVLFRTARALSNSVDAERAFAALLKSKKATDWDSVQYADFLSETGKAEQAGRIYEMLARKEGQLTFRKTHALWCKAASSFYAGGGVADDALSSARECLGAAALEKGAESDVAIAHRIIGAILLSRGVYSSVVDHARQAIAVDSEWYFSYLLLAKGLQGLERFSEAEAAARRAIELSDGKHSDTHFALGSAYFDQKKWSLARQSYETAARLDPKDASAAYNVAVSLKNDGFGKEAIFWFEETLRRNPVIEGHAEIRRTIASLKAG